MKPITDYYIQSGLLLHRNTAGAPRPPRLRGPVKACTEQHQQVETAPGPIPSPHTLMMAVSCARTLLAVSAVSSILAQPAVAADRTWLPRRHYRRIDDHRQREVDLGRHMKVGSSLHSSKPLACTPSFRPPFNMLGATGAEEGGNLRGTAGRHTGARPWISPIALRVGWVGGALPRV